MKAGHYLLLAIVVCLLCSCNKQKYNSISDQRLKDAVNICPGSYFVYVDSATGIEDSFYVYSHDRSIEDGGWEVIKYAMHDLFGNKIIVQAGGRNGEWKDMLGGNILLRGNEFAQYVFTQL